VHEAFERPTDDPILAAQRIHGNDGMGKGIVLQRQIPVWNLQHKVQGNIEQIAGEFEL